jgi:hypothetical protein
MKPNVVFIIFKGHKTVSMEMGRPPGTNGYKPPTEAGFPVPTSEMAG